MANLVVRNPFNNVVLKQLRVLTVRDGVVMLKKAIAAYQKLKVTPRYVRADALTYISGRIKARRNQFAKTIMQEAGKPITLAHAEVERCIFTFQYAAEECKRFGVQAIPMDLALGSEHRTGLVERFPIGPILGIAPFNFPLNLVAHKVAPALAVGNSIMIKPNIGTPLVSLLLKEVVDETALPKDSMQVLLLPGKQAEALVKHKDVAMVSFTGSVPIGWHIKQVAYHKKVALELGGNAFAVLTEDGDAKLFIDRVAYGAFAYAGQSCISVQTALINHARYEEVRDQLVQKVKKIKYGSPSNTEVLCGPVINDAAADRIMQWIADAVAQGAQVLCGGERKGLVISPTVLENVPHVADISCQEAFGPVLILKSFKTDREAIDIINRSEFGLQCGVFTSYHSRIRAYFENVEVGGVIVNDVPTYRIDHMPYGGVKDSGFGREGLRWTMDEMTEPRLLVIKDLCNNA